MKFNKYLIACACVFTAAAHAENNWYVLGSLGQSKFDASKSDLDSALRDEGLVVYSSTLDETDTGYKLQIGYQFTPNFAVEGGYIDLGKLSYSANVLGIIPVTAGAKVEASGWNIDALGILPLGNGFSLFAKAGLIDAKVKFSVSASSAFSSASSSDSSTDIKPLFGVGASYSINNQLIVRTEYERYKNLGDKDTTGEGDVDLFSAGIAYKF